MGGQARKQRKRKCFKAEKKTDKFVCLPQNVKALVYSNETKRN